MPSKASRRDGGGTGFFAFDLSGVRMSPVVADATGAVSSTTTMIFEQDGDLVSARYRGGGILDGYLIGHLSAESVRFRYIQAQDDGRLDVGMSNGRIDRLPDGRLRLIEHFEWQTRPGSGTNVFEELPPPHEPLG